MHVLRGEMFRRAGTSRPTNGAGRVGPLDRPQGASIQPIPRWKWSELSWNRPVLGKPAKALDGSE